MSASLSDYRKILNEYFLVRREVNPSYSLRSYARDLGMPSSNLSNVLRGKQGLSIITAKNIVQKLKITGFEKDRFINLVLASDARSKKEKLLARKRLSETTKKERKELQDDYFRLISDWYYFAILELVTLDNFVSDHSRIASQLGLEKKIAIKALERLVRLGLLHLENNNYISTSIQLDTKYDVPSVYIKKMNAQLISKAAKSVTEQEVDRRELSTLTIAIDKSDLNFIKNEIRNFKDELDKKIMSRTKNSNKNGVYCLAIQFFDLLKEDK